MDVLSSLAVEIAGGFVTGIVLAVGATAFTAAQQVRSHNEQVGDLLEDNRRWFRDRMARLEADVQQFVGELNQRGLLHSSAWLQGIEIRRRRVLQEYRDEISVKRRRYRRLWMAEGVAHRLMRRRLGSFPALALTDEQRDTLASLRADVQASHIEGIVLAVNDPTSLGREPDIRRFEAEGDQPYSRRNAPTQ